MLCIHKILFVMYLLLSTQFGYKEIVLYYNVSKYWGQRTLVYYFYPMYNFGQNFVSGVHGNGKLLIKAADFSYWVCIVCTIYMLRPRICGKCFLSFPQKKTHQRNWQNIKLNNFTKLQFLNDKTYKKVIWQNWCFGQF